MNAGDLRERIILLTRTVFEDDSGEVGERWWEERRLWASIRPLSNKGGSEHEGWFGEQEATQRFEVTIRACHLRAQRVEWNGDLFKILSIAKPASHQKWMTFIMEKKGEKPCLSN